MNVEKQYKDLPSRVLLKSGNSTQIVDNRMESILQAQMLSCIQGGIENKIDFSKFPKKIMQQKGEFKVCYNNDKNGANSIISQKYDDYAKEQDVFENNLGFGLFKHPLAMEGADNLLRKIMQTMKDAGKGESEIYDNLGISEPNKDVDLGSVLVKDVADAIAKGNIREKMGMVFHVRKGISKALYELSKQSQLCSSDGKLSQEMQDKILALKPDQPVSWVILDRLPEVSSQVRPRKTNPKKIAEDELEKKNVPLSQREKKAALMDEQNKRMFIPGKEVYELQLGYINKEKEQYRRVLAGLSGSTDMYFHMGAHLAFTTDEYKKLRLASLAQMLVNEDHSYHEIMHVAKVRAGLTDYEDELPVGYTQLSPLSEDEILSVAGGAQDFPGDKQVRDAVQAAQKQKD